VSSDGDVSSYFGSWTSFKTEHEIEDGYQYLAPNDEYSFSAFVFVIERTTNKSIPIDTFEIQTTGPGDFGTKSDSFSTTNAFTYNAGSGPITVNVTSSTMFASVVRSAPARALTYSMFAINWILVVCSIVTTSVAFNRGGEKSDVGITLLPITVILTIPTIRSLYVGSPSFGIYLDVVGFFPQMLIVASCTVVVLTGYGIKSAQGGGVSTGERAGV